MEAINRPKKGCTVGLLAISAEVAYRVKKDDRIDPTEKPEYDESLISIAEHGYAITKAISPQSLGGTGQSPLSALCISPQDKNLPIIISFRGTKIADDILADILVGVTGVMGKEYRDAAFEFYEKIRNENSTSA